jgi:hypothetical protein
MYTVKIEGLNKKDNGELYASVSFTRDTGEIENYKEQYLVSEAIAEVRDEETGEIITVGTDEVFGYHDLTRPKLEVIYVNFDFTSKANLDSQIVAKKQSLESIQELSNEINLGEYTPEVVEPVSPTVSLEPAPEQVFITSVNRLKNALAMEAVGAAKGVPADADNTAYINGLLAFIKTEVTAKPEYLDIVDLSALLQLMK